MLWRILPQKKLVKEINLWLMRRMDIFELQGKHMQDTRKKQYRKIKKNNYEWQQERISMLVT
jgi:hypothetical protein